MKIKNNKLFVIIPSIILAIIIIAVTCIINVNPPIKDDFADFVKQKKAIIRGKTVNKLTNKYLFSIDGISDLNRSLIDETAISKPIELISTIDGNMFALSDGRLKITKNNQVIWESLQEWWVDSFVLADSDNDGSINVNFSVWKVGSFGTSMPFWIKKNDMSIKNHFFVFNFKDGKMKHVWMSSNLSSPNCEFKIADIDNDGKNDLIVIEGDYYDSPKCKGKYVAVWKWNDWGFSNEWRSKKGDYENLSINSIDNQSKIITSGR